MMIKYTPGEIVRIIRPLHGGTARRSLRGIPGAGSALAVIIKRDLFVAANHAQNPHTDWYKVLMIGMIGYDRAGCLWAGTPLMWHSANNIAATRKGNRI